MTKKWYDGLEEKVDASPDYKSYSEKIVAGALESQGIRFAYEDPLEVKDVYGKKRTWHPDFHLKDLGIILEYVGRPDDKGYMEGIRKKEKVYAAEGVKVVWIYPADIWEEADGYRIRKDAEENILNKVYAEMRSGKDVTRTSRLDEKLKVGYSFQSYSAV